MGFTNVRPIWCQNTINIPLQRDRNYFGAFGTYGRGTKSTRTTNFEIVWYVRVINVFEFVSTGLECRGHAGEGVWIGGGGRDGNGGEIGCLRRGQDGKKGKSRDQDYGPAFLDAHSKTRWGTGPPG